MERMAGVAVVSWVGLKEMRKGLIVYALFCYLRNIKRKCVLTILPPFPLSLNGRTNGRHPEPLLWQE